MASVDPPVLVLGASGMLGHEVWRTLSPNPRAWATVRAEAPAGPLASLLDPARTVTSVCAEDETSIARALEASGAEVVVNCIGVVKQDKTAGDLETLVRANALLPHHLARICEARGVRLLHVSTDCVFSGRRGAYTELDEPDPVDDYGRSKLLGEPSGTGCLTLRTSIIGRELDGANGLLEWFLRQRGGTATGFRHAVFSGLTTRALAELLGLLIREHPDLSGLWHAGGEPIDKLTLLRLIDDALDVGVDIRPSDTPVIDRSLDSSRFRAETGWEPPSWPAMVAAL